VSIDCPGTLRTMRLWELDFGTRTVRELDPRVAAPAAGTGCFRWLDLPAGEADEAVVRLHVASAPDALCAGLLRELEFADGWLVFGLTGGSLVDGSPSGLNVLFSQHLLVTIEFGRCETLGRLRQGWREDFTQFAQSPGFFLFELSDHYTTSSQARLHHIERLIDVMQARLFGKDADDTVFGEAAALLQRLQDMRQNAVVAGETFEELATRNSAYIAASTQPFIARNALRMERLAAELLHQREALMGALNLYIGMTGHHTGQLLKRLTAFSMIFLPLSFLAGVFGMNFSSLPGTHHAYAFAIFCGSVAAITSVLLVIARRGGWF
jgi:Mg2+ and Co2+ transporter CorA